MGVQKVQGTAYYGSISLSEIVGLLDDIKDKVKEAEEVVEEVSKASKSVKGKVTKTVKKR